MFRALFVLVSGGLIAWFVLTSLQGPRPEGYAQPLAALHVAEEVADEAGARWRKPGAEGGEGESDSLPAGVVEVVFEERAPDGTLLPYAGSYEVVGIDGERVEQGETPEGGEALEFRLNPGSYTVRIPGTTAQSSISISAYDRRGKRLHLVVRAH